MYFKALYNRDRQKARVWLKESEEDGRKKGWRGSGNPDHAGCFRSCQGFGALAQKAVR